MISGDGHGRHARTWRWAISSALAARTSVTLQAKRRARPASGDCRQVHLGALILTTLKTCGLAVGPRPCSWPPTFTPGGNSLLGMVRTRLSSRAKGVLHCQIHVGRMPTAWPSRAASTLGKMFS